MFNNPINVSSKTLDDKFSIFNFFYNVFYWTYIWISFNILIVYEVNCTCNNKIKLLPIFFGFTLTSTGLATRKISSYTLLNFDTQSYKLFNISLIVDKYNL